MTRYTNRRTVLKRIGLAGVAATTLPLAGCSSGSGASTNANGDGNDSTPTDAPAGAGASTTHTVDMNDELAFEPQDIEVSAGTTVTWENLSSIGHTVTAYEEKIPDGAAYFASGGFDSETAAKEGYPAKGNVQQNGTFEYTFETKGTYEYYCIPHELNGMVGTVTVV
jgi:plastocyanin